MDSRTPSCSVVIPTRNRYSKLREALATFTQQTYRDFEIVVALDGSEDESAESLRKTSSSYPFPIQIIESEHRGPAFARNNGAKASRGHIVLFVGDDCLSEPNLVETHVRTLDENPSVGFVQGLTLWHPEVDTPFQEFLYTAGYQADYEALKKEDGSWEKFATFFCMTTNFSARRSLFLEEGGFDEAFTDACWEDVEFGFRIARHFKSARTTAWAPQAVNYHHHSYDLASFALRQYREGFWRPRLCEKLPGAANKVLDPEKCRHALKNDWRSMIETQPTLLELSTRPDVNLTDGIKESWRSVLDTATYQGVNDSCQELGDGWQLLPLLDNGVDLTDFVEALLVIREDPAAALSGDRVNRLESSPDPWLVPALRSIALAKLGRKTEADKNLRQARSLRPDVRLASALHGS